ncbi:SDR family NAD(P)-dependent oxidoreductase [Streptomyces sp. NPDC023838]|uniref:SDR family oxidoreductase n=1 Tax=Streptomyces sp. NPDC023838 TaxID=3154325 RepID=UPI00340B4FA0
MLDVQGDAAAEDARDLSADHTTALAFKGDVTAEREVAAAVREAAGTCGRLDVVVNCGGAATPSIPFTDTTSALWQDTLAINLMGPVHVSRAAILLLRAGRGAIVNISSVAGLRARAQLSAYCAAKAVLVSLTQTLALELAPDRVRVNCIAPGATTVSSAPCAPGSAPPNWPTSRSSAPTPERVANRAELSRRIADLMAGVDLAEAAGTMLAHGIPASPVRPLPEVVKDPQVRHREMVQDVGGYRVLGVLVKPARTPGAVTTPPRPQGADSRRVLSCLGIASDRIEKLVRNGVVQAPPADLGSGLGEETEA